MLCITIAKLGGCREEKMITFPASFRSSNYNCHTDDLVSEVHRINFSRDVPSKDDDTEIYGQKIVLDLPNKIDDESFLTNFSLLPCTYASKRTKPIFLKVHSIFSYSSRIGNVVLVPDEKNNVYETNNFSINNQMGKP